MTHREIYDKFGQEIVKLVGRECWSVIAGKGTGSHIHMGFGTKIARQIPLTNPNLTEDERLFDAELTLFVTGAAWRVENSQAVLCTDTDENCSERYNALKNLAGKKVVFAQLFFPSFDLILEFTGGVRFQIFCDFAYDASDTWDDENYIFFTPKTIFKVGLSSKITIEESHSSF